MSADDDKPNYYGLLCIDPNATKEDIKKAYRKQALLFHPDKMKPHMKEEASAHFQLISEAYEILSDDTKRALYDRYGHEGVKAGGDPNPRPGPAFDVQDPFFSSFGMPAHPPFADPFARHHQHMRQMFESFGNFPQRPSMFDHHVFQNPWEEARQARSTMFSSSPFANMPPQQRPGWTGMGTLSNPFVDISNGGGGFTSSSSTSSSFGGGGGVRTTTKTTSVNGRRTTVTEVTDAQGVTTRTVQNSDGTRETFVNGVPTAIEGASSSQQAPTLENNMQQPIMIPDDEDRGMGSSNGYRLGGSWGNSHTRAGNTQNGRSMAPPEPIVLDMDDDELMFEELSRDRERHRTSDRNSYRRSPSHHGPVPPTRPPASGSNLHHPRMGRGQTLRGTTSRHSGN